MTPTERPSAPAAGPSEPNAASADSSAQGASADASPPGADASAAKPAGGAQPAVENRWWVDSGGKRDRRAAGAPRPVAGEPIVGATFFAIGKEFDQDRARASLTDGNLNWIKEANPAEGTWAYLAPTPERSPKELVDKVQRILKLPKWARGVIVDSGTSLRAIASGTPVGERIVELTLGSHSCFDAWAGGEWVREKVFRSRDRALREGGRLLVRYLRSPGPGSA